MIQTDLLAPSSSTKTDSFEAGYSSLGNVSPGVLEQPQGLIAYRKVDIDGRCSVTVLREALDEPFVSGEVKGFPNNGDEDRRENVELAHKHVDCVPGVDGVCFDEHPASDGEYQERDSAASDHENTLHTNIAVLIFVCWGCGKHKCGRSPGAVILAVCFDKPASQSRSTCLHLAGFM